MFSIPDLLDDSIDHSLSFETSKLLQATEHSTTDKAENPPENRYSAESDSDEGSVSNTIVVDYILVPDSPIEANIPPPELPRGRLITCSQVTRSQSIATSASALLSVLMRDPNELITFENILESPESQQWEATIQKELETLEENQTWIITEPPVGARVLRRKWVYKIKRPSNGPIRYKARWVVKGFEQIYSQDYN